MKVLIVERKPDLARQITFCLQMRYPDLEVALAQDTDGGIRKIETESPNLVFLACSLPASDCTRVIADIREFSDVGLVLITGPETTDLERAEYLEAGADECIEAPFNPMEVLGRVNALVRRINGGGFNKDRVFAIGDELVINFGTREVFVQGSKIKLTGTEYKLLHELVRNAGRVLPHQLLLEKVWSPEYASDVGLIKKYIYRLRRKIEPDPDEPQLILSERGVGYRFARQA